MIEPALNNAQRGANQTSLAEHAVNGASQVTQFVNQEERFYYPVGTGSLVNKMQGTKAYGKLVENTAGIRGSETAAKLRSANSSVDAFTTRVKDGFTSRAKGAWQWTKETLHLDTAAEKVKGGFRWTKRQLGFKDAVPAEVSGGTGAVATGTVAAEENGIATAAGKSAGTAVKLGDETAQAAAKSGGWGLLGEIGQKLATPLVLLVGAFQTHKAAKAGDGHGASKAAGGTVGTLAGGLLAGAGEGLLAGAILGAPLTPIGSFALGVVGAIIGGWVGSKVADKAVGKQWQAHLDKNKAIDQMLAQQKGLGRSAQPAAQEAIYEQNGAGLAQNHYTDRVRAEQQAAMTADQSMAHG